MDQKPMTGTGAFLRLAGVLAVLLGLAWALNKLLDLML
jgi:hypothetical protein